MSPLTRPCVFTPAKLRVRTCRRASRRGRAQRPPSPMRSRPSTRIGLRPSRLMMSPRQRCRPRTPLRWPMMCVLCCEGGTRSSSGRLLLRRAQLARARTSWRSWTCSPSTARSPRSRLRWPAWTASSCSCAPQRGRTTRRHCRGRVTLTLALTLALTLTVTVTRTPTLTPTRARARTRTLAQALPGLREAGASLDAVDRGMHSLALSIGETAALAERLSARVQVIELQPGRVRLRWGLANPNPSPNPEPNPNATR